MKNKTKFMSKILFSTILFMFIFVINVFAGTGVIQLKDFKSGVVRGKNLELTLKVKSDDVRLSDGKITLTYNQNYLEFVQGLNGTNASGGAGTVSINGGAAGQKTKQLTYTVQFKTLQVGDTTINVSQHEIYDTTNNLLVVSKTGFSTIKVKPTSTSSKNANLKSMEIVPGELDKSFDPAITEYNTEVNADIESLGIDAKSEDPDAKVVINGNELQVGNNKVSITVTAPNNTTIKTYVINVYKTETSNSIDNAKVPVGSVKIEGRKLFIYSLPLPAQYENMPGFTSKKYNINGVDIPCLTPINQVEESEYVLFYGLSGINQDATECLYRYDLIENTLQRYYEDQNVLNAENIKTENIRLTGELDAATERNKLFIIVIAGLSVLIIILFIVLIVKSNKSNKKRGFDDENDDFFDDNENLDNDFDDYKDDTDYEDDYSSKKNNMNFNRDNDADNKSNIDDIEELE